MKYWIGVLNVLAAVLFLLSHLPAYAQECIPTQKDKDEWESVLQDNTPRAYLLYLTDFPKGCFRGRANLKIRELLQEFIPLEVGGLFTADNNWITVKEGQDVSAGGAPVYSFRIRPRIANQNDFSLDYKCNGAGTGISPWMSFPSECPRAWNQQIWVRMRGLLEDFYNLIVTCDTHIWPGGNFPGHFVKGNEEVCGIQAAKTYMFAISVTAKRKPFDQIVSEFGRWKRAHPREWRALFQRIHSKHNDG